MLAAYKVVIAGAALLLANPPETLKVVGRFADNNANGTPSRMLLIRSREEFERVWVEIHGQNSRINGVTYSADPPPALDFAKRMVLFVPVPADQPAGEYFATANKNRVVLTFRPYEAGAINVAAAGGSYTFIVLTPYLGTIKVDLIRDGVPVEVMSFPKLARTNGDS
jgi:hypothetical protein